MGSSENGRDPKDPKDRREHFFVNEKVFKTIRKNNDTLQVLLIGIKKTHSTAMASIRSAEQQNSNSHSYRILILSTNCSAKSANSNSTVFRIRILLVTDIFLWEIYRFQKTLQTPDAQKNKVKRTKSANDSFGLKMGKCIKNNSTN